MTSFKKIIRSVFAAFCFSTFGIGALSIGCVVFVLIRLFVRNPEKRRAAFSYTVHASWIFFVGLMSFCGLIRVHISSVDRKKLKSLRGVIVVANHPSLIDVVIVVSLVRQPICLVKSSLSANFFMRPIISNVYVNNDISYPDLLAQSAASLAAGHNLVIFPEGTRTRPGVDMRLQNGASRLALDTNADIIPVRIDQSERILGKGQPWYSVGSRCVTYRLSVKRTIRPKPFCCNGKPGGVNARHLTAELKKSIEKK